MKRQQNSHFWGKLNVLTVQLHYKQRVIIFCTVFLRINYFFICPTLCLLLRVGGGSCVFCDGGFIHPAACCQRAKNGTNITQNTCSKYNKTWFTRPISLTKSCFSMCFFRDCYQRETKKISNIVFRFSRRGFFGVCVWQNEGKKIKILL